jgi:hypothetical protein
LQVGFQAEDELADLPIVAGLAAAGKPSGSDAAVGECIPLIAEIAADIPFLYCAP